MVWAVAVRVAVLGAVVRPGVCGVATTGVVRVRVVAVRVVVWGAAGREEAMVGAEMEGQRAEVAKAEKKVEAAKEGVATVAEVMAAVMVAVQRVEVARAAAATVVVMEAVARAVEKAAVEWERPQLEAGSLLPCSPQ